MTIATAIRDPMSLVTDDESEWHLVYYTLAAFIVLTICLSLYLSYQVMQIYAESVQVNQQWTSRSNRYSQIAELAAQVNAPGNDIFESLDVAAESEKLRAASEYFMITVSEARRELQAFPEPLATQLSTGLDEIDVFMGDMLAETRQIFTHVGQNNIELAAQRMAAMDKNSALLAVLISHLRHQVSSVQQQHFAAQMNSATALRRWENRLAVVLALLVVALALYGRYQAIRIKATQRQQESASRAILASETRHKAVIDSMRDAQLVMDPSGIIQSFNPAAEKIFGYAQDEIVGRKLTLLMPEPDQLAHAGYVSRYLESGRSKILGMRRETGLLARRRDGSTFPIMLMVDQFEVSGKILFSGIIRDISEDLVIREELQLLKAAVEHANEAIAITDTEGRFKYVNPAFEIITGYSQKEAVGQTASELLRSGQQTDEFYAELWSTITSGHVWEGKLRNRRKDGTIYDERQTISPILDPKSRTITGYIAVKRDITEQLRMGVQLVQAQKLESIGQLAAGIAHEINTPTQYVGDNTRFVKDAFDDMGTLLDKLAELSTSDDTTIPVQVLIEALAEADVDYLKEEIPRALEQSIEGVNRVATIVRAMKEFSHPAQDKTMVDLNAAIKSTLTVATSEYKYVADLETDLSPDLPQVNCLPGEFNQVILNMVVNASHAIADVLGDAPTEKGVIAISTRKLGDWVEIRVSDTGCGMPAEVKARIFDPFFTTKEVGKGTGQGLNIAHNVIVNKHDGELSVESTPGKGSCFIIRLPLEPSSAADDAVVA